MRVGDDGHDEHDTAVLPPWLPPRYEKVEKLPRRFVASVVVLK